MEIHTMYMTSHGAFCDCGIMEVAPLPKPGFLNYLRYLASRRWARSHIYKHSLNATKWN